MLQKSLFSYSNVVALKSDSQSFLHFEHFFLNPVKKEPKNIFLKFIICKRNKLFKFVVYIIIWGKCPN